MILKIDSLFYPSFHMCTIATEQMPRLAGTVETVETIETDDFFICVFVCVCVCIAFRKILR